MLKPCLQLLVLMLLLLRGLRLWTWLRPLVRLGLRRPRRASLSSSGRIDATGRSLAGEFRRDLRRRGLMPNLPQERVE